MSWHGLDIGGANLKWADGIDATRSHFFPLWQRPKELAEELARLCQDTPLTFGLAVTMTGELADCFATKADGVAAIVSAALAAAAGRPVRFYAVDGRWLTADEACRNPLAVAASNWHALGRLAGRLAPHGGGLLLDVGSTTTDVIPLNDGRPVAIGATDPQRLLYGELRYTGVQRSPLCAVVRTLPWRGVACPVAQELFATTWDAYLILGDLPEQPGARHTADGRPATRAAAHDRLARALCADRTMLDANDAVACAQAVATAQRADIEAAVRQVIARQPAAPTSGIVSGAGEFLARRALADVLPAACVQSLSEVWGPTLSQAGPAHAVAVLAREELRP